MKECPKCNKRYDDSWSVCLSDRSQLIQAENGSTYKGVKASRLEGVDGWLGIYVWLGLIANTLAVPMVLFEGQVNTYLSNMAGDEFVVRPIVERTIIIIISIIDVYACYLLLKLKSNAVKVTKISIVATCVLYFISVLLVFEQQEIAMSIMAVAANIILSIVWFIYFTKSVRVTNTYKLINTK